MARSSSRLLPSPSTVYQKIWPSAVASGARYGVTPGGIDALANCSFWNTRLRAVSKFSFSSKMMVIMEKLNSLDDRITFTLDRPWSCTLRG